MTDHHHDHDHTPPPDDAPLTDTQAIGLAIETLLIDKGIIGAAEMRTQIEFMDSIEPSRGAKVVARAWTDPEFKTRLLENGTKACLELDIDLRPTPLTVVENTGNIHNVIVCTLCSCYPRMLLGLPPDWYKSRAYRSRVVVEPRSVLQDFGTELPTDMEIRVHDSTADLRYMVLPARPAGTEHLNESQLAELVTRDCMVGVALPAQDGC